MPPCFRPVRNKGGVSARNSVVTPWDRAPTNQRIRGQPTLYSLCEAPFQSIDGVGLEVHVINRVLAVRFRKVFFRCAQGSGDGHLDQWFLILLWDKPKISHNKIIQCL